MIYQSQIEGITNILENINDQKTHFYLRVHPYLSGLNNSQIRAINSLNFANLTIIPAESTISSYALIFNSEKIIIFNSTTGIEANYWGKPVILLGRAKFENFGACYIPKSQQQCLELINQELKPLPKNGAVKYAYWEHTKGVELKYYKPEYNENKLLSGTLLGKKITYFIKDKTENLKIINDFSRFNIINAPDLNQLLTDKPVVSFIIHGYENQAEIIKTVNSLMNQVYTEWELIIIDDGFGIKTSLLKVPPEKIKIIYQDNNGPAASRKTGIINATGDYLMFIEEGAIILPYSVEGLVRSLYFAGGDIALVFGHRIIWDTYKGICITDNSFDQRESQVFDQAETEIPLGIILLKKSAINITDIEKIANSNDLFSLFKADSKIKRVNVPVYINYRNISQQEYLRSKEYNLSVMDDKFII